MTNPMAGICRNPSFVRSVRSPASGLSWLSLPYMSRHRGWRWSMRVNAVGLTLIGFAATTIFALAGTGSKLLWKTDGNSSNKSIPMASTIPIPLWPLEISIVSELNVLSSPYEPTNMNSANFYQSIRVYIRIFNCRAQRRRGSKLDACFDRRFKSGIWH